MVLIIRTVFRKVASNRSDSPRAPRLPCDPGRPSRLKLVEGRDDKSSNAILAEVVPVEKEAWSHGLMLSCTTLVKKEENRSDTQRNQTLRARAGASYESRSRARPCYSECV
jgi:hypothetical protein